MISTTIIFIIVTALIGFYIGMKVEQYIDKDVLDSCTELSDLLSIKSMEANTYEQKYKEYFIRSIKAENDLIELKNNLANFEREKLRDLKLQEDKLIELTLHLDRQKAINEQLKYALDKHLRNSCYDCVNRLDENTYIDECGDCPDAAARKILGGVLIG
jgi:uncharacterized protein HemY